MENETNPLSRLFAFNLWANTELIKICMTLTETQLEAEAIGVYGRLRETFVHLIRSEGGYIHHLTKSRPWPDDFDWDNVSIKTLLEQAKLSGNELLRLATAVDPSIEHIVQRPDGNVTFYNWTVLGQALYHGVEHRTQIKILLTQLGVEHADLDVWDYTTAL